MRHIRWNLLGLLTLFALIAPLGLAGCGEPEAPPVQVDNVDFEAAEQEATKEYGGM